MDAPAGQRIGYARVSAPDQSLDRQIDALGGVDRLFTDEASGSTRDRAGLRALIDYVRDGDTVVVTSMDRLARSVRDLRDLVDRLTAAGATVTFLREAQTYRPGGADPDDPATRAEPPRPPLRPHASLRRSRDPGGAPAPARRCGRGARRGPVRRPRP